MFEIKNITEAGRRFIDEWFDETPFITAHTSGSTGTPKEIHLPKEDMRTSAISTIRRFNLNAESRLFSPLSANYIAGKMMIVRAIIADCELTMEEPSNNPFQGQTNEFALMPVVPSQCAALFSNHSAQQLVKKIIVGGAPMTKEQEEQLMKMPWKTFATYGMTETCSHVALREAGNETYEAMPGITFSRDSRNCLTIHAPAYSFKQLQTNDVVNLITPTQFKWLGRADNVINSGGIKLFPEQIEKMLEGKMPTPFFIRGAKSDKWGECVEIVVEGNTNLQPTITTICEAELPRYARPKQYQFVAELPRTPNGKLKRN